jgi:hypothetical protein
MTRGRWKMRSNDWRSSEEDWLGGTCSMHGAGENAYKC